MKIINLFTHLKKRWDILILSILFVIFAVYDYLWITRNSLPPSWDDSWHLMSSINYYRILINPSFDMFEKLIHVDWYYPPFYKFSTAFIYMILGVSINSALMTNIFYFGILLFATYSIGKILFNRETGVLAAIIISMYPVVFNMQRIYLLDLGLTVLVTMSIFLLLRTENFRNLKYSLAFGALCGMSLLVKWTALFFIAGPFIYIIYESFFKRSNINSEICEFCGNKVSNRINYQDKIFCSVKCKKSWKNSQNRLNTGLSFSKSENRKILNLIFAIATAIIIASIWYIPNGAGAYKFIMEMDTYWAGYYEFPSLFSLQALTYYPLSLIGQASFILSLVFIAGLIYIIRKRPQASLILSFWIIFPLIILTLLLNKQGRYIMPFLASVALISAFWINSISNRKKRLAIMSIVILVGGFQVITMATGNNSIHDSLYIDTHTQIGTIFLYPPGSDLPKQGDWKHEEILDDIFRDAQDNERIKARGFGYIVVVPDHPYINGRTFEYYNFKKQMPFQIFNGAYMGEEMFYGNFFNIDYIIIKSGDNEGPYKKIVDNEYKYFEENGNAYALIKQVFLPEGSQLSVYRNKYLQ